MFRPGMKVVCVHAADSAAHLEQDAVYTIDRVAYRFYRDCHGLYIAGVPMYGNDKYPWYSTRFRPLVTTDISVFTNMLKTRELEKT